MIVSQKAQYAVRAVFELAKHRGSEPVTAAAIAEAEFIPVRFLENILGQLRQAGFVESVRGKEGGYRLRRPAARITVGDVIRLIQGPIAEIGCVEPGSGSAVSAAGVEKDACPLRHGCVLLPVWEQAHRAMMDVFDSATFEDLVEKERAANRLEAIDYVI
jgi:Rrf2 family protein